MPHILTELWEALKVALCAIQVSVAVFAILWMIRSVFR